MSFGLSEAELTLLRSIVGKYVRGGIVLVYGSRAKGTHTDRSDIDLAVKGLSPLDGNILADLRDEIEESDFPYLVDIQYYEEIRNQALREHIDRVGAVLFES